MQAITGSKVSQITCHDTLCIDEDTTTETESMVVIRHTKSIKIVMEKRFDVICLLHPNPICVACRQLYIGETGFQHGRYIPIAAQIIEECLVPQGHVIVQFDDEISDKGSEFLEKLQNYYSCLTETPLNTPAIFPSDNYRFLSLHHLRKTS